MLYVTDAINRLDQFQQELLSKMPSISRQVSADFLVRKKQEINKVGIGKYSKALYSAHFLKGKELNSAGKAFLDDKIKKKEKTNWAGLRQAQGLNISFVNVYYSGQMLNSTGIERNNTVSYRFYSIIGANNDEAKQKMYYNMMRYGRFLNPNVEQRNFIGNFSINEIGKIYKRILLNK